MTPSIEVYLAATHQTQSAPSMVDILISSDPVVMADLITLAVMSVVCWGIIAAKLSYLRRAAHKTRAFIDAYYGSGDVRNLFTNIGNYAPSPVASVFQAGYEALRRLGQDATPAEVGPAVERAMRRAQRQQSDDLQSWITLLATTGSTAPFIGLFGTVWGILMAFLKLGTPGAASTIDVVGPDIAHALVATAVGLVAAIPAVMAYNGFNRWVHRLEGEMEGFSADFLNRIRPGQR